MHIGCIDIDDIYIFIDDKGLQVKGCHAQEIGGMFSVEIKSHLRANQLKLIEKRFNLNIRMSLLTEGDVNCWSSLSRAVMYFATLKVFILELDLLKMI